MYLLYNSQFEIVIFLILVIFLSKSITGSQLENDTEMSGFDLTTELNSNITGINISITELNITDVNMIAVDNSLVNPLSNGTLVENYTVFQDYNETYPSNFSYEENVTYTPQIDEARVPDTASSVPCTCDLTGDSCDVNCCCDKDCTDRDKDAFFGCILPPINIDERHCISKTIIYDHMKMKEKAVEHDGLFCIVHDHLKQRHEYLEPPILRTLKEYQKFVPNPIYSWISSSDSFNNDTKELKSMKAGESLYIRTVDDGILTEWTLPTDIFNGYCGAYKAVKYMIDDETTCHQITTDVKQACLHNKWLRAKTYKDYCFVTSSQETTSSEGNRTYPESEGGIYQCHSKLFPISVIPSHNDTCRNEAGIPYPCTFDDDVPEYDAKENSCKNVVTQVHYSVIHNGSVGITDVSVAFETSTISTSQKSISQYFSVRYYGTKNAQVFRRSGNPGYLLGHPILAGNVTQNVILLASDSNYWLTVMGRFTNGYCCKSNCDRLPVKFGDNLNTGCLYKISQKNISCRSIQEQVMTILNGFNPPSCVGMFGNSDIHNIGEWIKIQHEDKPTKLYSESSPDGGCSSIVLGVDIKIAYANTGSLTNPQRKIIGVLYKYLMSEYIQFPCKGSACNAQVVHTIHLKTSVTFIDASRPAFPMYAQIPVTKLSFPHDFFYPLISDYSGSHIGITLMSWSFYVAFAWLIAVFRANI